MKTNLALLALTAFAVAGAASAAGSAQSSVSNLASAAQGTQVSAVLTKRIDSRNAKVGDEVLAKTTSEAKLADGTRVPKGSRLVGHVTEVQPKSHENRDGHVAFCFDYAVLRSGQEIPVHVLMRSMAGPRALPVTSDAGSDEIMAGPGWVSEPASHTFVGGLAGGAANQLAHTTPMAPPDPAGLGARMSTSLDTRGRTSASAGQQTAGRVANLPGLTFATVHRSGGGASASANSSAATMLTAHGRNAKLESGSQMAMTVWTQQ